MFSSFPRNRLRRWARTFCWPVAVLVCSAVMASGQADQGAITGTVLDPTGAAVPNAQITLTSVQTGLVLKTTSDASGVYLFAPIKIGDYTVSANAPGFSTVTQTNLHVDVQQRLNVPLTLKTGEATETVTVTDAPPLLQTEEGSTGQVIETKAINDTPLNGRNWVFRTTHRRR